MTTLLTLFGGLLGVLLLHAASGWIKGLSPLPRAVVASGVPLLAYFIYIVGRWPGLDVAAIHISVFVAAGFVLYMFSQYRSRGGRLHWAPRILIGFFTLLAVINASLLYISTRGLPQPLARLWLSGADKHEVYSGFSGVVEHGEEAAKAVSSALSQAHSAAQLGWQVDIDGLAEQARPQQRLVVRVRDRTGLPVSGLVVEWRLTRPGAPQATASRTLVPAAAGEYAGLLEIPGGGRWLVEIRSSEGSKTLYSQTLEVMRP